MQKLKTSFRREYPMVRLSKSDVVQIYDIIKPLFREIRITTAGYELQDMADLDNITETEVTSLRIDASFRPDKTSKYNNIDIAFRPTSCDISLSDDSDLECLGAIQKINSIVSARKYIFRWILNPIVPMALLYPMLFLTAIILRPNKTSAPVAITTIAVIVILIILWATGAIIESRRRHSVILLNGIPLSKRVQDKFHENLPAYIVGAIVWLLSILGAYLIGVFTK